MGRRALIALLVAAGCSSKDAPKPVVRPDGGEFCTAGSHSCPGGTRCVNSYCVATCTNGAACPPGMFCAGPTFPDDVCAPIAPVTCASTDDCPVAQQCLFGHCISVELIGDGGLELCAPGLAQDKCAPDAVCYTFASGPGCIGLPSCGQDGGCPTGSISQACNLQPDGGHVMEGKAPICPLTQCAVGSDCIAGALCAHASSTVSWGTCQYGITGDPCSTDSDCASAAACETPDAGSADAGDAGAIARCKCVITTPDAGVCAQ
jgi:Dickkopf-like protein